MSTWEDQRPFKEGDLMEWQVMTTKIKALEKGLINIVYASLGINEENRQLIERVGVLEGQVSDALSSISNLIALTSAQHGRITRLESFLQADPAFLPYGELQRQVRTLEDNVESLERTLELWQEVSGIEVLVSVVCESGNSSFEDYENRQELAAQERFGTRFEYLPEQILERDTEDEYPRL